MKIRRFFIGRCAALVIASAAFIGWALGWIERGLEWFILIGSSSPGFASVPPSTFTPGALTAANTALDGTGTTLLIATAPAVASPAGSVVERIRCMHKGTDVATVARVFLNNGSTPTVAGNNSLIAERTIPANTLSQVAESAPQDILINQVLKGHATTPERIYVSIGTAVAAGIQFTAIGGDL
jgi:hypothetical protein